MDSSYLLFDRDVSIRLPLWLGVDLFFIISGFCIAFTLQRGPSATAFWAARVARIQPAYMAAVLLTFGLVAALGLPGREVDAIAAAKNLFWLNAIGAAPHVDGVYWSLVVELKYYAAMGLIWLAFGNARAATLAWAALCIATGLMAEFGYAGAAATLLHPYNFMFLFGMTLCNVRLLSRDEQVFCFAISALGVLTAARYGQDTLWVAACMALSVGLVRVRRVPGFSGLAMIGTLSYAWYLVHQNIGYIVIREVNAMGLQSWSIAVAMAVTLALALALHHLVELRFQKPIRRFLERTFAVAGVEASLAWLGKHAKGLLNQGAVVSVPRREWAGIRGA